MTVGSLDRTTVILLPSELTMIQPKDMTLFTITDSVLVNATYPKKGIAMKITMKRKVMSELMTTYFPSLLLMMITFATTLFKPFFFEAALSVNLTTMLMMTTIFMSKMEGLPPTSTTKMIDVWLILCQLVPFIQVILLTVMEYLREDNQELEKDEKKCQKDMDMISIVELEREEPVELETQKALKVVLSRAQLVALLLIIGKSLYSNIS